VGKTRQGERERERKDLLSSCKTEISQAKFECGQKKLFSKGLETKNC